MKIVATTRTKNEERNIKRFIEGYGRIADEILIVDGNSTDDTVSIAKSMGATVDESNYHIVSKPDPCDSSKLFSRNWQGKQINACIQGAIDLGADWVIFDDCDCVPTVHLQKTARNHLSNSIYPVVGIYRMYVFGSTHWFPEMNIPGQSLWAWNPSKIDIWAVEDDPWNHEMIGIPEEMLRLDYPESVLHYFAPDEETIQRKREFYFRTKETEVKHPIETSGRLDELPGWAVWQ